MISIADAMFIVERAFEKREEPKKSSEAKKKIVNYDVFEDERKTTFPTPHGKLVFLFAVIQRPRKSER